MAARGGPSDACPFFPLGSMGFTRGRRNVPKPFLMSAIIDRTARVVSDTVAGFLPPEAIDVRYWVYYVGWNNGATPSEKSTDVAGQR